MVQIIIYCAVSFNDKALAKKLGAKWDMDKKKWFWEFDFDDFYFGENRDNLHTYFFKPFLVGSIGKFEGCNASMGYNYIDNCFKIARNRQLEYCKNNIKPSNIKQVIDDDDQIDDNDEKIIEPKIIEPKITNQKVEEKSNELFNNNDLLNIIEELKQQNKKLQSEKQNSNNLYEIQKKQIEELKQQNELLLTERDIDHYLYEKQKKENEELKKCHKFK